MKTLLWFLLPFVAAAQTGSIEGLWQGALDIGPTKLRLALHVDKGPNGGLTASLDSIDQGANGIPVDTITVAGDTMRFEIKQIAGSYEGTVNSAKSQITGKWSQGG